MCFSFDLPRRASFSDSTLQDIMSRSTPLLALSPAEAVLYLQRLAFSAKAGKPGRHDENEDGNKHSMASSGLAWEFHINQAFFGYLAAK